MLERMFVVSENELDNGCDDDDDSVSEHRRSPAHKSTAGNGTTHACVGERACVRGRVRNDGALE